MQDIDFARFSRRQAQTKPHSGLRSHAVAQPQKKNRYILPVLGVLLFVAGIVLGARAQAWYYQKQFDSNIKPSEISLANIQEKETAISDNIRVDTTEMESASADGTEVSSQIEQAIQTTQQAYLILARIYVDEKEAHRQGMVLKKEGLRVFLARSGEKMKVYVGPVEGKDEAYEVLAKVKKHTEFKGAILYEK